MKTELGASISAALSEFSCISDHQDAIKYTLATSFRCQLIAQLSPHPLSRVLEPDEPPQKRHHRQ